jgi:hypothetical protein
MVTEGERCNPKHIFDHVKQDLTHVFWNALDNGLHPCVKRIAFPGPQWKSTLNWLIILFEGGMPLVILYQPLAIHKCVTGSTGHFGKSMSMNFAFP